MFRVKFHLMLSLFCNARRQGPSTDADVCGNLLVDFDNDSTISLQIEGLHCLSIISCLHYVNGCKVLSGQPWQGRTEIRSDNHPMQYFHLQLCTSVIHSWLFFLLAVIITQIIPGPQHSFLQFPTEGGKTRSSYYIALLLPDGGGKRQTERNT